MLFNSLTFFVFMLLFFPLYWHLRKVGLKYQNIFILVASYVFYGWWDWRFLSLIFLSSAVDYSVGKALGSVGHPKRRKFLLAASITVNLGFLLFFKYFGFFLDSFTHLLTMVGFQANVSTLRIILPMGISFYTFQTMTYTIDVFKKKIEPINDPVIYFSYVSFFPQLVAGPIERASNLLPQFSKERQFDICTAKDGLRQILWGLFKKVVIADRIAVTVNYIFSNYKELNGLSLVLGAFYFSIQIYCDFSGYSDIAIGSAKLLGFKIMRNFAYPYFSRDIAEFWRRWHISLTTWFRDYIFVPLCGVKPSQLKKAVYMLVTFTISGLWHGAAWTFVFWGIYHAILMFPRTLKRKIRLNRTSIVAQSRFLPSARETVELIVTFSFVTLGWIFFRSVSIADAISYFARMFNPRIFVSTVGAQALYGGGYGGTAIILCCIVLAAEWITRKREHALEIGNWLKPLRWTLYTVIIWAIVYHAPLQPNDFIYFEF